MKIINGFSCLLKIIFVLSLFTGAVYAACNVCQENKVACVNISSFYPCFGGNEPNTDRLYHCDKGFDCTNLNAICLQSSSQRTPSCGDNSKCNRCSAHRNYLFSCRSRTTFQMCYGAINPSSQMGKCPTDHICDANSDTICVNINEPHTVTCDIEADPEATTEAQTATPTPLPTPSPTPSPTPTPSSAPTLPTSPEPTPSASPEPTLSPSPSPSSTPEYTVTTTTPSTPIFYTPTEVCRKLQRNGLFPTQPNDPFCSRYIYCHNMNGNVIGTEHRCSAGTYFNVERQQCTLSKPSYCY